MRLQTKTGLVLLPFVALAVLIQGAWSVLTATSEISASYTKVMQGELEDYIDLSVTPMYELLRKNGLDQVDSYVLSFQEKAVEKAVEFRNFKTGHMTIVHSSGKIVAGNAGGHASSGDLKGLAEKIILSSNDFFKGEINTKHGREIVIGKYFPPWEWAIIHAVSADEIGAAGKKILNSSLIVAAICVLGGFFLIFIMFRAFIIRPVSVLKNAAAQIEEHVVVDQITVHSSDELGDLARSMEAMARSIKGHREEQKSWQTHLENEIEAGTRELTQANESLQNEISMREQVSKQMAEALDFNRRLISASPIGILAYDQYGRCTLANEAAAQVTGGTRDQVLKQNFRDLESWNRAGLRTAADKVLEDGQEQRLLVNTVSSFGREVWLDCLFTRFYSMGQANVLAMVQNVTEQKLLERKIENQKEELERSNRELDDFAYVASHDLKEPLRGIANYSGFLLEDYGAQLDDEGVGKLQTLIKLCRREENLIEALLEYSRVGRKKVSCQMVDLNPAVRDAAESVKMTFPEQKIFISTPSPLPVISCDSFKIQDIFANLITNAVKYNDNEEKLVEVGALDSREVEGVSENEGKVFYVKDNGIGVRRKHQEKIFQIFKRLHGRDKYGGGSGAGLTIVKKIIERHGGRIWVESEPGVGSTFFFTLKGVGDADNG